MGAQQVMAQESGSYPDSVLSSELSPTTESLACCEHWEVNQRVADLTLSFCLSTIPVNLNLSPREPIFGFRCRRMLTRCMTICSWKQHSGNFKQPPHPLALGKFITRGHYTAKRYAPRIEQN